jgi:hypothetical protein
MFNVVAVVTRSFCLSYIDYQAAKGPVESLPDPFGNMDDHTQNIYAFGAKNPFHSRDVHPRLLFTKALRSFQDHTSGDESNACDDDADVNDLYGLRFFQVTKAIIKLFRWMELGMAEERARRNMPPPEIKASHGKAKRMRPDHFPLLDE